jgi:hypothetical protein
MRDEAAVQQAAAAHSKSKGVEKAKPQKRAKTADRRSFHDLTEAEQERRKQIGILILCGSVFLPLLPKILEVSVPRVRMFTLEHTWLSWLPWLSLLITVPFAANFVFRRFWR